MLTKVFALVLVVLIGLALGVATLQQKDAQIAELQMVKNMAKRGVFAYGSMLKVNCWVHTDGRVTYSPRLQPARSLQEIMRAAADLV